MSVNREPTISTSIEQSEHEKRMVVINTLRLDSDDTFREKISELRNNAPHSVLVLNKEHTGSYSEKFEHTFRNLNKLDTEGLTSEEKFIARASMLMHDCLLENALNDLELMVDDGLIDYSEAYRISQHIWWHDFLGSEDESSRQYAADIKKVIRNEPDLEINRRIFKVDIADYGFSDQYREVLSNLNNLDDQSDPSLSSQEVWKLDKVDKTKIRYPTNNEVFIHAVFVNKDQGNLGVVTKKILINLFASGCLRSGSLNSQLEKVKAGIRLVTGFSNKLNVVRIDPDESPNPDLIYSKSDSLLSFVLLGKDISQDCLVCPISENSNDSICDTAGLANRFDNKGNAVGLTIDTSKLYYFVRKEGLTKVAPILTMEAFREGVSPEQFMSQKVVVCNRENISELVENLRAGKLDIETNNLESVSDLIEYQGPGGSQDLSRIATIIDGDDISVTKFVGEDWWFDYKIEGLQSVSRIIKFAGSKEKIQEKMLTVRSDQAKIKDIRSRIKNNSYYDETNQVLYFLAEGRDLVAIPNVKHVTQKTKKEGNFNMEHKYTYWLDLTDDRKVNFKIAFRDFDFV